MFGKSLVKNGLVAFTLLALCGCLQFSPPKEEASSSEAAPAQAAKSTTVASSFTSVQDAFPAGGPLVVLDSRNKVKLTITGPHADEPVRVMHRGGKLIMDAPAKTFSGGKLIIARPGETQLLISISGREPVTVNVSDGSASLNL